MKLHNVKRTWPRPLFMSFKKHYCPVCREALQKIKVSKIVDSKSEEAKDFDVSSIGEIHKIEKLSKKAVDEFCVIIKNKT